MAKKGKDRKARMTAYGPNIKNIFKWFIKPFIQHYYVRPDENTLSTALAAFFCAQDRLVVFAKAHSAFEMPGKTWGATPTEFVVGAPSQRAVAAGDHMVVRIDETMPNRIDIEFGKDVFVLTKAQWDYVEPKVTFVA